MNIFQNLDLLSVGIVIASSGMLGFSVYFNNTSSVTNKTFLTFSIITLIWGGTNYLFYQIHNPEISIWFLRAVLFFAVWQAFIIFQLFFVFPSKKTTFPKWYKYILIPVVILTSILMLTPLGIEGVKELSPEGRIIKAHNGQAIPLFGLLGIFLVVGGLYAFIRKAKRAINSERKSYWFILTGTAITFALIIIFNLILPSAFDDSRFIPLGALFVFPLIAFTSYAILRHKLFNIKIAAVGIFTFLLSIVTFLEIIFVRDLSQIIFRSSIFIFVLIFGIMLIKTVLKEVRLREEIETLVETLQKTNARLKELDRLKSEFVSFATHQIRAPLTTIRGYTSLIQEGSYGDVSEKVKGALDKIYQSSNGLVLIVGDYLNISRIEMGTMKYNFIESDFGKLVSETAEELKLNVTGAGLKFIINIDNSKKYKANIDIGKMKQVIINLIDNAVKYTKKGSITISLSKDEERNKLLLQVSDTGIGISKEIMQKLFGKFIRAKNASDTNTQGTGLGLYLAKQMTLAHSGGKLWVESEGEGKGSTFFVELNVV